MIPTESKPVSGVAIKNDVVAPRDAPLSFRLAAVGITAHEHNGRGAPITEAFRTEEKLLPPKCLNIFL